MYKYFIFIKNSETIFKQIGYNALILFYGLSYNDLEYLHSREIKTYELNSTLSNLI